MSKPSVRRVAGGWEVQRPGYGFTPPNSVVYPTWKAALASLDQLAGSTTPVITQGSHTLALWSYTGLPALRPRRIYLGERL